MLTNSYSNSIFDKNYMWNDQQTHDGFGVFSPCIQGNSKATMDTISLDDKSIKEELIQAATNRLRHRLLEQRFESFIAQVVELQSRLEMIKIDTTSSIKCMGAIDSLSEQQFDIFERRLDTHKEDLDIFLRRRNCSVLTNNVVVDEQKIEKSAYTSSLSCLSKASFSSLSSIFLSQKSSLNEEESEYDHLGSKPQLRRRRKRQQLKKLYEDNSHPLFTDNNDSDWSESILEQQQQQQQQVKNDQDDSQTSISPFLLNPLKQGKIVIEEEKAKEEEDEENVLDFSSTSFNTVDSVKDLPTHPYDYCNRISPCHSSSSSSSSSYSPSAVSGSSVYDVEKETGRNALDDALSFLNDLASDTDDGGFREDIFKLLDLRHSNIKTTPCSLEESGSYYHNLPPPLPFFLSSHDISNKKHPSFILSCIYGSLKWFRFLLIMSIAMAITLRRGPTDLVYNIHSHHPHIFMNKVW